MENLDGRTLKQICCEPAWGHNSWLDRGGWLAGGAHTLQDSTADDLSAQHLQSTLLLRV